MYQLFRYMNDVNYRKNITQRRDNFATDHVWDIWSPYCVNEWDIFKIDGTNPSQVIILCIYELY